MTGAFLCWNQRSGLFGQEGAESLGSEGQITMDFPLEYKYLPAYEIIGYIEVTRFSMSKSFILSHKMLTTNVRHRFETFKSFRINLLIEQSECPKRNDLFKSMLYIVFDDVSVLHILDLGIALVLTTDLKSVVAYFEVRYG